MTTNLLTRKAEATLSVASEPEREIAQAIQATRSFLRVYRRADLRPMPRAISASQSDLLRKHGVTFSDRKIDNMSKSPAKGTAVASSSTNSLPRTTCSRHTRSRSTCSPITARVSKVLQEISSTRCGFGPAWRSHQTASLNEFTSTLN